MRKKSDLFKRQAELLKPIIEFYRRDKVKLVKFLIKEGYLKKDIARVLDVTPGAISHLLERTKEVK